MSHPFLSLILAFFISSQAIANTNYSAFLLGDLNRYDYSLNVTPTQTIKVEGKLGYGAGLLIESAPAKVIGIEFGAAYLKRQYKLTVPAGLRVNSADEDTWVHLPLGTRVHLGLLSIAAGGFYEIGLDDQDANYGAWAGLRTDFGPIFIEGRYLAGLKDYDGVKQNDIFVMLGLSF